MKATEVTTGLAESNGSLLPGIWRDSLHVTCGLTACTPGSAPGPTLGDEYGKTLTLYSITERGVPELIPFLGSQPAGDVSHKPGVIIGCRYFPPGLQLPAQPLRGLLTVSLLGEQRHDGCEQFA